MPATARRRQPHAVSRQSVGQQFTAAHYLHAVSFGAFDSSLGVLLVAATEHGICFVAMGDDTAALKRDLHAAFPRASITEDASLLEAWAHEIERLLAGAAPTVALPLCTSGTPFQERVWAELRRIPSGERYSYQALAARIGKPTAARAVAQACARNRVAVLIPCHRVVRGDGELGGYRWGVARKSAILDAERDASETRRARDA